MRFSNDVGRGVSVVAIVLLLIGIIASAADGNSVEINGVSAVVLCAAITLGHRSERGKTIAPPFACLKWPMGWIAVPMVQI